MISEIIYEQEHERQLRNMWYKAWALEKDKEISESYYRLQSEHDYAYRVLCGLSGEKYLSPAEDRELIECVNR